MNQKNREPGFYWVVMNGESIIAEWSGYDWWTTSYSFGFDDDQFDEIDERRIVREEPSK